MTDVKTEKPMNTAEIIAVIDDVKPGQFLVICCDGMGTFSKSVEAKEHNKVTFLQGGSIFLSTSGWCYSPDGSTLKDVRKVERLAINEACRNCPHQGCQCVS